jgi:hypothetical protein
MDAMSIVGGISTRETFSSSSQASNRSTLLEGTNTHMAQMENQLAAARDAAPGILSAAYGTNNPSQTLSPLYSVRRFIF